MILGFIGRLFPLMFRKVVYGYTAETVPELDIRAFQKKHKKEYEAMVKRTPSVGSMKDNIFAAVMYMACYRFSYYKADPDHITMDVFDGMIDALCKSDMMKRFYQGKTASILKRLTNMSEARSGPESGNTLWTGSSISPMISRCRNTT